MTSKPFTGTNAPDLSYVPRVIHCPLNLPHRRLVCQGLSLLRLRPVRCGMMFDRCCTAERNSITPHHGLRLTYAHFMAIRVGWVVPRYGTILSAQPVPDLRPSEATNKIFERKFQCKISSRTAFLHSVGEYLFLRRSALLWDFAQCRLVVCYRPHIRGSSNRSRSSWITIIT
jgi:hypothetical protein